MINIEFFPVFKDQLSDKYFSKLSPARKLYYWLLSSEFNKSFASNGFMYKSDDWFAAALDLSVETIRKARVHIRNAGWIKYKSGYMDSYGRGIATTYLEVKWARPSQVGEGRQFAKIQRHAFEMLLAQIRAKRMSHEDVVTYIVLSYLYHFEDFDRMIVYKGQIRSLTGINNVMDCIGRLHQNFSYASGARLFDYYDNYHTVTIKNWATPAEPSKDETNRKIAKHYEHEIKNAITSMRESRKEKEKEKAIATGRLNHPEQLPVAFNKLFEEFEGKQPSYEQTAKTRLIELGEADGVGTVYDALIEYFRLDVLPNPTNSKYRTLARFLKVYELIRQETQFKTKSS